MRARIIGHVTSGVLVHFEAERTEAERRSMRRTRDNGEVGDFLAWQMETGTFPIQGISSGGGAYTAVFHADDAEAVGAWLTEHGVVLGLPS